MNRNSSKLIWKCLHLHNYIIHHGGNHCCKELPIKELLFFMNIVSHMKGEKVLDYSDAGHSTSRRHLRKHSRLYLSLFFWQKNTLDTFHAPICTP